VIILAKKEQLRKGQRIALFSTLLILFLSLLKAVIGYVFDSPLLVADAWQKLFVLDSQDRFPIFPIGAVISCAG